MLTIASAHHLTSHSYGPYLYTCRVRRVQSFLKIPTITEGCCGNLRQKCVFSRRIVDGHVLGSTSRIGTYNIKSISEPQLDAHSVRQVYLV
jgi:hypothetical protein